jgi:hypothetical protein
VWRVLDIDVLDLTTNAAFILLFYVSLTLDKLASCRVTTGVTDLQLDADPLIVEVGH